MSDNFGVSKYGNNYKVTRSTAKPYDKNQSFLNRLKNTMKNYLTPPSWVQSLITPASENDDDRNGYEDTNDELIIPVEGHSHRNTSYENDNENFFGGSGDKAFSLTNDKSSTLKRSFPEEVYPEASELYKDVKSREPLNKRKASDFTNELPDVMKKTIIARSSSTMQAVPSTLSHVLPPSSIPNLLKHSLASFKDKLLPENYLSTLPSNGVDVKFDVSKEKLPFKTPSKLYLSERQYHQSESTKIYSNSNNFGQSSDEINSSNYFSEKTKNTERPSTVSPFYNKPVAYGGAMAYQGLGGWVEKYHKIRNSTGSASSMVQDTPQEAAVMGLSNTAKKILKSLEESSEHVKNKNVAENDSNFLSGLCKKYSVHGTPVSPTKKGPPAKNKPLPVILATRSNTKFGTDQCISSKSGGKMKHEREKHHQAASRPLIKDSVDSYTAKLSDNALAGIKLPPVKMQPLITSAASKVDKTSIFDQQLRRFVFSPPDIILDDKNGENMKHKKFDFSEPTNLVGSTTTDASSSLPSTSHLTHSQKDKPPFAISLSSLQHNLPGPNVFKQAGFFKQPLPQSSNFCNISSNTAMTRQAPSEINMKGDDLKSSGNQMEKEKPIVSSSTVSSISSSSASSLFISSISSSSSTSSSSSSASSFSSPFNKNVTTTTTDSIPLSVMFKPSTDQWKCPTCFVPNSNSLVVCSCCATAKPQSTSLTNSSAPSTASTLVPPVMSSSSLAPLKAVPLNELFKTSLSDKWSCPTCMVSNKSSDPVCLCCGEQKPSSSTSSSTSSSLTSTTSSSFTSTTSSSLTSSTFSSTPSSFLPTTTTSTSNPALSTTFNTTSNWNGTNIQPTKPGDMWICAECYVKNKNSDLACLACESRKPGMSNNDSPIASQADAETQQITINTNGGFSLKGNFGVGGSAPFNPASFGSNVVNNVKDKEVNQVSFSTVTGGFKPSFQQTSNLPTSMPSTTNNIFGGFKFGSTALQSLPVSNTIATTSVVLISSSASTLVSPPGTTTTSGSSILSLAAKNEIQKFGSIATVTTSSTTFPQFVSSGFNLTAVTSTTAAPSSNVFGNFSVNTTKSDEVANKSLFAVNCNVTSSSSGSSSNFGSTVTTAVPNIFKFGNSLSTVPPSFVPSSFPTQPTITSSKTSLAFGSCQSSQAQPQFNFGSFASSQQNSFGQLSSSAVASSAPIPAFTFGQQNAASLYNQPQQAVQPAHLQNTSSFIFTSKENTTNFSFNAAANNSGFGGAGQTTFFGASRRSISDDMMADNDSASSNNNQQLQQQQQQQNSVFGVSNISSANTGFNFGSSLQAAVFAPQPPAMFTFGQPSQQPAWNEQPTFNFTGSNNIGNVSFNAGTALNASASSNVTNRVIKKAARRTTRR